MTDDTPPIAFTTVCQYITPETLAAIANALHADPENVNDPLAYMALDAITDALRDYFTASERETFHAALRFENGKEK